ncbi:MAG: alpha/beta fold hydrolase [Prevotella sp.]|nr:alpha/beta fold hydrolase [Prevotella sp.]
MKKTILFLLLCLQTSFTFAQPLKTKTIDEGGTGLFKAIAVKEAGLPDFVVYRPKDMMHAHARCGALPLLMFANGGCMDTSVGYERMLTEIASQGYVVVAIGEMQDKQGDRPESHTDSKELQRGMNWILQQARTPGNDYYQNIDSTRIAAAGHSCGGAQVLFNAADPRLKTCLILNAGMGDMEMAGASRASLPKVHTPILYITGGPSDVAFQNARKDYERINHVPAVWADHPASGHGGTYNQPNGGVYARVVLDWLDWQLKGQTQKASTFLSGTMKGYEGWTVQSKNFVDFQHIEPLWIMNGDRQIFGELYTPTVAAEKSPVVIISHGFNGTHHYGRNYFDELGKLGYKCYAFDFACGSVNSRSDSNTMNMSILDEQSDLRAVVNYFRQQPDIDPSRIVLIGESQGGLVSALTAGQMAKEVSRLILVYPALCIPDNWNERYPQEADIPDTTRVWGVPLGKRFFKEARALKPFEVIGKFRGPVLIVQGDKDPVVSMEDSKRAISLYNKARLHVIPGAGHGFKPQEFQQSIQQIVEFLK